MLKVVLSWSSGKDSAWALHFLRQRSDVEVVGLLTTINREFRRVAMHGTRLELVRAQAEASGLPLIDIPLPWPCSNHDYEAAMRHCILQLFAAGTQAVAFGDLFLEDIRAYRERQLVGTGLRPMFPLWKLPTRELASSMIAGGLRARVVTLDPKKISRHFAGAEFDETLLSQLPKEVDPCAENGEFHTFAYDGPMFRRPVLVRSGETVERDGFVYADLLPEVPVQENQASTFSP